MAHGGIPADALVERSAVKRGEEKPEERRNPRRSPLACLLRPCGEPE